jgi:antitoxin (DNA-binding transcriptional repressor) of toxin-antitoxin stability system
MDDRPHRGAEEARNQFPRLLETAERGQATVITRHGRPVAVVAPLGGPDASARQAPLTPLEGSGRGLWGADSAATLRELRGEWRT